MEDYSSAYLARMLDTECLHTAGRTVGTVHFGGIVIECLLKSIIIEKHGITEWHTEGNTNHGIKNPKHDLLKAINCIPELRYRIQQSPQLLACLNTVQTPISKYIDIRYDGNDMVLEKYREWYKAYKTVIVWLQRQKTQLNHGRRKK